MSLKQLDHPLRQRIVLTLGSSFAGMTFEELRKRLDSPDRGKFGYHLRQLQPEILIKNQGSYNLSFKGQEFYGHLISGNISLLFPLKNIRLVLRDLKCQFCKRTGLLFETFEERFQLVCLSPECKKLFLEWDLKPLNWQDLGLSPLEVVERSWLSFIHSFHMLFEGLCPRCNANIKISHIFQQIWFFQFSCPQCIFSLASPFTCLLYHPFNAEKVRKRDILTLKNVLETPYKIYSSGVRSSIIEIPLLKKGAIWLEYNPNHDILILNSLSPEEFKQRKAKELVL